MTNAITTKLANRLNSVPEYIHAFLTNEVRKVEQQTKRKVLNFGPGTPDIKPSAQYIKKFHDFINMQDAHRYPSYNAIPILATALQEWYAKRFSVSIETDELLPLLGAKDGIAHLPLALLNEGDEMLVPNPGYPAFSAPALLIGAKLSPYDLLEENYFKINLSFIKKSITKRTKAIWVNFPSNPTGQTVTIKELEELIKFARKHNIFILYDNSYSEITFGNSKAPSILEIAGAKDIAVEISSFSKTFSFAGFRMGWIVGNKDIIKALAKVKTQMDSGLSLPLQRLGAFALTNFDEAWHQKMLTSYQRRQAIIAAYLPSIGLKFSLPKAALYIWAKIPDSVRNSEVFAMELLQDKQILVTPGTAFGTNGERFVRISICVNIDKIEEYFAPRS